MHSREYAFIVCCAVRERVTGIVVEVITFLLTIKVSIGLYQSESFVIG